MFSVLFLVLTLSFASAFWPFDLFNKKTTVTGNVVSGEALVAHYNFDGNVKDSVGGHDGAKYGATYGEGKVGQAINFDGINDYVEVKDTEDLRFGTSDFSIEFWFKTTKASDTIISKTMGGTPHYRVMAVDGNILGRINDGTNAASARSPGVVSDGLWHKFLWSVDRQGDTVLYIDDIEVNRRPASSVGDISNTGSLYIGSFMTVQYPYKGSIDELKFYNYALKSGTPEPTPTPTPNPNQTVCTADVKECPDGTFVGRDPNNGCQFRVCGVTPIPPEPATCTDSDGGKDIYVKGIVSTGGGGGGTDCCAIITSNNPRPSCTTFVDSEMLDVGNAVWEDICTVNNEVEGYLYSCPEGCFNGACIQLDDLGRKIIKLNDSYPKVILNSHNEDYEIELIGASDTSATIKVVSKLGESSIQETNEGDSWDILFKDNTQMTIYVQSADETNLAISAELRVSFTTTIIPPEPGVCMDSDNGNDRYTKGEACLNGECKKDLCETSQYNEQILTEYSCGGEDWINSREYRCSESCSEGACKKVIPVQNNVCQPLIDKVANPSDLNIYGLNYNAGYWSNTYSGDWYINNEPESFVEYSTSWSSSEDYSYDDQYSYQNAYVSVNVDVFENEEIDLQDWIKQETNYQICNIDNYWDSNNKENKVYICSWDILRNRQDLGNYDYKSRQVLWVNDNVVVRIYVSSGKSLTDEEVNRIAQKRINEFLNDLKSNDGKYVGWEEFDISYLARSFISQSLSECPSDVENPINDETGEECQPSWNCKLEPVICPEYGYQNKICNDNSCGDEREERIYCSPGICSGCYVPRWFGDSNRNNICIPYGIRFEKESGDSFKLVEGEDDERLTEGQQGGFSLVVESDTSAKFEITGRDDKLYSYELIEGESVDITEGYVVLEGDEGVVSIILDVKEVVYSPDGESYVDLIVRFTQNQRVIDKFNAYCDYTGEVKQQKTKGAGGDWASCQNNYECDSNLCSGGECVEINDAIKEASQFKGLFIRAICRLGNLFNEDEYNSCIGDYLGY